MGALPFDIWTTLGARPHNLSGKRCDSMQIKNTVRLGLLVAVLASMAGCAGLGLGLATGVGASAGVAASKEGGLSQAAEDFRIQTEINNLWFRYDVDTFSKLDLTVTQGRVLVIGVVQNPEARVEAVRLAWQPKGVTQVINEVQVAESGGITGFARDTWITTRLRGQLTFDKQVESINYSIDTVKGVVYLMGTAQTQQELDHVIGIARTVPDVKRVVSYVRIAGTPLPKSGASAPTPLTRGSNNSADQYRGAAPSGVDYEPVAPPPVSAPIEREVLRN